MPRQLLRVLLVLGALALGINLHAEEVAASDPVQLLLAQLPAADYATKKTIVEELATHHEPAVRTLLVAFLEGHLFVRDSDQKIVVAEAATEGLTDVGTNNQLRRSLRGAIARFDLSDADPKVRRQAIDELARTMDVETAAMLRELLPRETDAGVRKALESAIAMGELSADDVETRLGAVRSLKGNLSADAFNRLTAMVEPGTDGKPAEADARIRMAANETLTSIKRWRAFYSLVETLFFGLSLGSVLTLAAIGLAITFGVMGVINMAHGELMMLGA
jgi:urea transport system permease protein